MNKRIAFLFFILFALACMSSAVYAQNKPAASQSSFTYTYKYGTCTITQYPYSIFRVTYKPFDYTTGENVTGAVVLKPLSMPFPEKKVVLRDGYFLLGDDSLLINLTEYANGYRGFHFQLADDEKIFGGGERALPINRQGYKLDLYNNPWYGYSNGADALNFSVPFFTSSKGYGLFFDNASKGYADIGKTSKKDFNVIFASGELTVYVIFGKDYKEILSSYYKLTGTQPLPPRWALGCYQSRFGYTSETQAKEIHGKMQREQMPHDAVIFDLFWFGDSIKNTLGNLDWVNKTKWPNPKRMIADFKKDKVNSILIAEPFILKGTKNYDPAKKYLAVDSAGNPFTLTNFYFGYGGILDVFRKDAADWIWKNHYQKQIRNGVAGWWTDLGEPEKHPSSIMHNLKDLGFKRKFGADEVHNVYGHYWNKMLFEKYAAYYPNERLFHLNRSGFAGSQRYSIFPWSGDVSRSWDGLKAQLPLMLGMSMSGIPYIHADAGGFAGGEGDNELYVRWLQFAAFTPIFRPHGTALYEVDKNTFSFPSEPALIDTPYRNYARDVVKQRYAMLPYNYTLAYKQATKGDPIVAPLYYYYPKDTAALNTGDEFMFGENILVAPVIEKGVSERKLYLPVGKWYALNNNEEIGGGRDINVPVTIMAIPVYVKAGSIIVTSNNKDVRTTSDDRLDNLAVDYYYDTKPSQAEMYDDDGVGKNAIAGKQFQLLNFSATPGVKKTVFNISSKGTFKGMPVKRKINFRVHGATDPATGLYVNGKFLNEINKAGHKADYYTFAIDFYGKPLNIEIK